MTLIFLCAQSEALLVPGASSRRGRSCPMSRPLETPRRWRGPGCPHISQPWVLGYVLCLCGLAVVAALLRDRANRRQLLWTGGALALCAVACFAMAST